MSTSAATDSEPINTDDKTERRRRPNVTGPSVTPTGEFCTDRELARWLKVGVSTLQGWRYHGHDEGPPYVRIGKRQIRYRVADVVAWLEAQTTSRPGKA